jgi:hypothetical protein
MTVAELIEELEKFDGDLEVAYQNDEDSYNIVFGSIEEEDLEGKFIAII